MIQIFKIVFALALLGFLPATLLAQEKSNPLDNSRHLAGFIVGYGDQNTSLAALNVNYDYEVILFQAQYHYILLPKKTWDLHLVVQPQYNVTKFKNGNSLGDKSSGYEFGLNVGMQLTKTIFRDFLSCYLLVSSGPHYVSALPDRQSEGFIFSDNIFMGINIKLKKSLFLNMRSGIRHISNLGLNEKNGGVENLISGGGLLFNLKKTTNKQ